MPIEQTRFLYEILVRGNAAGGLAAAHAVWAETGRNGNVVPLPAEPIKVSDVQAILGAAFSTLAADNLALRQQIDEVTEAKAAVDAELKRYTNGATVPTSEYSVRLFQLVTALKSLKATRPGMDGMTYWAVIQAAQDAGHIPETLWDAIQYLDPVPRGSKAVAALAAAFDLEAETVDEIFATAAAIEV